MSPVGPERLLRDYFHAKDENRPHMLDDVFTADARLEIRNRSELISFPAATAGRDAIADVLVRRFNQTYENIYSYCLSRPNSSMDAFSCDWLVTMSDRATQSVRIGCGHYEWTFQRAPTMRVKQLVITIARMLALDRSVAGKVRRWLAELDYPWTSAAAVTRSLPLPEVELIRAYLCRQHRVWLGVRGAYSAQSALSAWLQVLGALPM